MVLSLEKKLPLGLVLVSTQTYVFRFRICHGGQHLPAEYRVPAKLHLRAYYSFLQSNADRLA